MNCEDKQSDFKESLKKIQDQLKTELTEIATSTQKRVEEISDKAENSNDLTDGALTAAGTVIGGALGGALGAVVGEQVTSFISQFFEVNVTNETVKFSIDLPEVTIKDQEWIFDLPSITMKDNDISFDLPTVKMVTKHVGDLPSVTCRMVDKEIGFGVIISVPECTTTMQPQYMDVPETFMETHKIVMGLPEVSMQQQKVVVGIPEFTMRTQEMSFDIPSITIKTKQDVAKDLSDMAQKVVAQSSLLASQKKESIKGTIQMEIVPKAVAMFSCFKEVITTKRQSVFDSFTPAIGSLTDSIKAVLAQGVPETDDDVASLKSKLNDIITQQSQSVTQLDESLKKLDKDMENSVFSLTNF